jgi:outer membrane protein assembly factor BamB
MLTLLLLSTLQDWPQFRGPSGDGRSDVKSLPSRWSEGSPQIAWRTRIEGLGWSSPVIAGGKVWLTTAAEEGRSLRAVCVDAGSGAVLHDVEVFRRDAVPKIHGKNSHASPTPILDAGRVYVHFGAAGTACLSAEGKVLWRQQLLYEPVHGPGGSPVMAGNLLVVNCDGAESPFVAALDRASGTVRWKAARPESAGKRFSFCTPALVGGQLVSPGANGVTSYDPASGRAIWDARYPGGYSVVPRPVSGHGLVFVGTGYDRPTFLAIRIDGKGDVTQSHVAWKLEKGAPLNPSPLLVGDELYLVSDAGIATCLDAKTGRIHWQERLGGNFSASPLLAAGRIHFLDENGALSLVAPGTEFKVLGRNQLKGRTLASPAPQEGALILRTDTELIRIQE